MELTKTLAMAVASEPTGGTERIRQLPDELELMLGLSATALLLLVVSPIASFALSGFLLVNMRARTPREIRWILGLSIAMSISLMTGARPIEPGMSNDIEAYFEAYQGLAAGDMREFERFGAGLEVALPSLLYAFVLVLPPLSPNGLMFCFAVISALLLLVWIEMTFYTGKTPRRPALLGVFFVMLNLYYSTQLTRQFLSLIVLLFACTAGGRLRQTFFVVVAAMFHVSALAFFALYLLLRRGWVGWAIIILTALVLRLYFAQLLAALDILPEAAAGKLTYYLDNLEEYTSSDVVSMRTILLLCLISLVALIASRFRPDARVRPWLAAPWGTAAVHYLLLPIPLASLRTTLAVHSIVSGLVVYQIFTGRSRRFATPVFNVLLAYKLVALAMAEQSMNLRTSAAMLQSYF